MKKFEEMTMEDIKALYDEKVKQEELSKERPKRWRAEEGETYWYVDAFGVIHDVTEYYNKVDNYLYNTGNYFQTRKQAEEYQKKLILQQEYKDWCAFDCDWNDFSQKKWYAFHKNEPNNKRIDIDYMKLAKIQGIVYAESKDRIQEFIDKIGEEDFKKYILEVVK